MKNLIVRTSGEPITSYTGQLIFHGEAITQNFTGEPHYARLYEKERRQYVALEATKLGYDGQSYLKRLLVIDYKTMRLEKKELFNYQPVL